jgi:alpha-glucosidase
MLLWRIRSNESYDLELYKAGHHYIKADVHEWLTFIKKNKLVLLNEVKNSVDDIKLDVLNCIGYIEDTATYSLYTDDGISREPQAQYFDLKFAYNGELTITHKGNIGCKTIHYDIVTADQKRHKGVYHV